jgi:hypothetical protein
MKKQTQFKPNKAKNKANFRKGKKMLEFTLDVSSLALEFTLGCAYLFFCRGSGAFAWIRKPTIILIMLLADFTTLQGCQFQKQNAYGFV